MNIPASIQTLRTWRYIGFVACLLAATVFSTLPAHADNSSSKPTQATPRTPATITPGDWGNEVEFNPGYTLKCLSNQVLVGVAPRYGGINEKKYMKIRCASVQQNGQPVTTSAESSADTPVRQGIKYQCPANKVLTGISWHAENSYVANRYFCSALTDGLWQLPVETIVGPDSADHTSSHSYECPANSALVARWDSSGSGTSNYHVKYNCATLW
ncbi:hypothetical protein NUH87_25690 [Pseudomonas batumici]|uniref:hypothetical protein n=1 Tax=Pseudomonas batumici TaxID=226910 RepID=UPI0030D60AE8